MWVTESATQRIENLRKQKCSGGDNFSYVEHLHIIVEIQCSKMTFQYCR